MKNDYLITIYADYEEFYDKDLVTFELNRLFDLNGWDNLLALKATFNGEAPYPEYEDDEDDYEPWYIWQVVIRDVGDETVDPIKLAKVINDMLVFDCYEAKAVWGDCIIEFNDIVKAAMEALEEG